MVGFFLIRGDGSLLKFNTLEHPAPNLEPGDVVAEQGVEALTADGQLNGGNGTLSIRIVPGLVLATQENVYDRVLKGVADIIGWRKFPFFASLQPEREVLGVVVTVACRDVEGHSPEHLLGVGVGQFQFAHGLKKLLVAETHDRVVVEVLQGAEGLDVISGENGFLASTPREFSQHVLTLLEDPARATRMAAAAHALAVAKYDWATVANRLDAIYQDLVEAKLQAGS